MAEDDAARDSVHVQVLRRSYELANRREYDFGAFEGRDAIRAFIEDWHAPFERLAMRFEEALDLASGVSFAVVVLTGRYPGSSAEVHLRYASVTTFADGLITGTRNYTDIDEARAAAERLAQERADG